MSGAWLNSQVTLLAASLHPIPPLHRHFFLAWGRWCPMSVSIPRSSWWLPLPPPCRHFFLAGESSSQCLLVSAAHWCLLVPAAHHLLVPAAHQCPLPGVHFCQPVPDARCCLLIPDACWYLVTLGAGCCQIVFKFYSCKKGLFQRINLSTFTFYLFLKVLNLSFLSPCITFLSSLLQPCKVGSGVLIVIAGELRGSSLPNATKCIHDRISDLQSNKSSNFAVQPLHLQ